MSLLLDMYSREQRPEVFFVKRGKSPVRKSLALHIYTFNVSSFPPGYLNLFIRHSTPSEDNIFWVIQSGIFVTKYCMKPGEDVHFAVAH